MKRLVCILVLGILFAALGYTGAEAGEVEVLVEKLVEKEILTPLEAQIILDETKAQVAKELAEKKSYAVPSWAQKIKLKGDLRLRYQAEGRENANDRHRARYRYRLGVFADVIDTVTVGAGICSGGDDPRSTNETFDDQFETKDARLDYAFASWRPTSWFEMLGGKIKKNPVWLTSDLLWDGDINPEGAALKLYGSEMMPGVDLFSNTALFILDESRAEDKDPFMVVTQGGAKWQINDQAHLKAAASGWFPINEQSTVFEHTAGGNTLRNGVLFNDYDALVVSGELGVKDPIEALDWINYCAMFGDYVYAFDPSDDNQGFLAGFKFGDKKVKKQGQWQAKALYRYLESDAWLDIFPDSDAYGGATNVHGPEVVLNYALAKNVILGLDWYYNDFIDGADVPQSLVQADLLFKF